MHHLFRLHLAGAITALLVGCGTPVESTPQTVAADKKTGTPDTKTVTLHIDGFKKSKSGAT